MLSLKMARIDVVRNDNHEPRSLCVVYFQPAPERQLGCDIVQFAEAPFQCRTDAKWQKIFRKFISRKTG